jgi:hypothetical protein
VADGELTAAELRDAMRLYLNDEDGFLVKQGHPLALLSGRLNAYCRVLAESEAPPLSREFIDRMEAEAAEAERAKKENPCPTR